MNVQRTFWRHGAKAPLPGGPGAKAPLHCFPQGTPCRGLANGQTGNARKRSGQGPDRDTGSKALEPLTKILLSKTKHISACRRTSRQSIKTQSLCVPAEHRGTPGNGYAKNFQRKILATMRLTYLRVSRPVGRRTPPPFQKGG